MVYVDDMLMQATVPNGNRKVSGKWSHLTADTTEELHEFAARLGMKRAWFQPAKLVADNEYTRAKCPERIGQPMPGSRDHYDVTEPVREKAIRMGAVACQWGCEPWRDRKREAREADEIFDGQNRPEEPGASAEADQPAPEQADHCEPVNDGSGYGT